MSWAAHVRRSWRRSHLPAAGCLALALLLLCLAGCQKTMALTIGVQELSAEELKAAAEHDRPLLLLDVRDLASYRAGHIRGALSLRRDQLDGYLSRAAPPPETCVVLICYGGYQSQQGAAIVAARGFRRVFSLSGGMERWRARGYPTELGGQPVPAELGGPPVVATPWIQQLAMTLAASLVKPIYMLIALLIILALRGARVDDLRLIRRGLIVFLLGEGVCATNFFFAGNGSEALEALHGAGMVLMGTYVSWGLFELLDRRCLGIFEPRERCALLRLCRRCSKGDPVSCGVRRVFRLVAPALGLVALIPLCTPVRPLNLVLPIFGTDVPWERSVVVLLIEQRLYPLLALLAFTVASFRLRGEGASLRRANAPFFWGVGLLSYSLLRYLLTMTFYEAPVWADFWEEVTELIALAALGYFLWVFSAPLGLSLRRGAGAANTGEVGDERA